MWCGERGWRGGRGEKGWASRMGDRKESMGGGEKGGDGIQNNESFITCGLEKRQGPVEYDLHVTENELAYWPRTN